MANTIDWGKATQNNTNGFGKYQNTIDAGSIYADSYSGETTLVGTSAAFSYSKSSFHQDESDPTPTITGTAGGVFVGTTGTIFVDSGTNTASSTGQIDLSASTIDSHIITYTVGGVQANQTVGITASPFVANNFSMQFDGVNDYVDAGNILNFERTDAFSISSWVKRAGTGVNDTIASKMESSGNFRGYLLFIGSTNVVKFVLRHLNVGTARLLVDSTTTITDTNWHHILVTYDGSSNVSGVNIYIDGVSDTLTTAGTLSATTLNSSPFNIGARNSDSLFATANIDEVAIWNAELSSDAVQEIYNATANNTGKALDLSTDTGNYTNSSSLQYWNRLGD